MNPKQMQQMMQKMGMQQVPIPAQQVIIRTEEKDIIIDRPEVTRVTMMGQQTYQITGAAREEKRAVAYVPSDEDIATVMSQTKATEAGAKAALEKSGGDIAEAILSLQ